MSKRKTNAKSTAMRILLMVLISLIIGFSVYSWNAKRLVGNRIPMPFGVGAAVVLSGSMQPTLEVDDLVFIKAQKTYQTGDIVVYQSEGSAVIHRIVAVEGDTVTTQGDANNIADEPFPATAIKGKMVGKVGGVGKLVGVVTSPVWIVLILGAAILLLVLSYRKERDRDSEELEQIKAEIRKLKDETGKEREPDDQTK